MARPTQITKHPHRIEKELARAAGISLDKIAARYNVHRDSIHRHWIRLSPAYKAGLIGDVDRQQLVDRPVAESGSLLDYFRLARSVLERQLLIARACEDSSAFANLGRAVIRANDVIGRLSGEIRNMPQVLINNMNGLQINLLSSPAFAKLERMLLQRLAPFPDALKAVLSGIDELGAEEVQTAPVLNLTAAEGSYASAE